MIQNLRPFFTSHSYKDFSKADAIITRLTRSIVSDIVKRNDGRKIEIFNVDLRKRHMNADYRIKTSRFLPMCCASSTDAFSVGYSLNTETEA